MSRLKQFKGMDGFILSSAEAALRSNLKLSG